MTPRQYLRHRERALRRSLRGNGDAVVEGADRSLDLSERIRRHPWLALGIGAVAGGLLGGLGARLPGPGLLRHVVPPALRLASAAFLGAAANGAHPDEGPASGS